MTHDNDTHPPSGYRFSDPQLPRAPWSLADLNNMMAACLLGPDDVAALRRSGPLLDPQREAILDVWYGFVGSHSFLLDSFVDTKTGQPDGDYLSRVRARFGQWILDTARADYDENWLRYQFEIGRRHHRVAKNATDNAHASPLVPFRFLPLLAQPIVDTLRPFLSRGGVTMAEVDAMQNAWRKAVLLQVTLWSYPYIIEGDF